MTQEDKNLLFKDLCARLPYKVKASYWGEAEECECYDVIDQICLDYDYEVGIGQYGLPVEKVKPYLFPLYLMTQEQYNSLHELGILDNCSHSYECVNSHIYGFSFILKQIKTYSLELIEWLNKNHFDYRGLIEKSLALDATNLGIYE